MTWFVFVLVFVFAQTFVLLFFGVLTHEIGHAIPMYLFSKKNVNIFIGSRGDIEGSLKVSLGKITFYFSKTQWFFPIGMCSGQSKDFSPLQHIIVFAMGPLFTFILAIVASLFVFVCDMHKSLEISAFLFLVLATIMLIYNLNPKKRIAEMRQTDGYWIKQYSKLLFKDKDYQKKYSRLASLTDTDGEVNFLDHYETYVAEGFKSTEMLENAAIIAFNRGYYKKAANYLSQLENAKQFTVQDYNLRAYAEFNLGNNDTAKHYCAKALNINPNYVSALFLELEWIFEEGRTTEADNLLKRVSNVKNKGVNEYYFEGRIYLHRGEIKKAIEAFENVENKGFNITHSIYLSLAYALNGDREKALAGFVSFDKKEKPFIDEYINYALVLVMLKDYTKGMKILLKALGINHNNTLALNNMSDLLNRMERYQDAIDYADKGISITRQKYYLYTNKAFAQLMLKQTEEGKVTNDYGLALNPASSYGYRNMGIYYMQKGDNKLAIEYLQKAYDLDKTTFMVVSLLYDLTGKLPY
jgi:tetratricopeptide (TPR) repeat protein